MNKSTFHTAKLFRVSFCLLIAIGFLQAGFVAAQNLNQKQNAIWQKTDERTIGARGQRHLNPEKYSVFRMNKIELDKVLKDAPLEFTSEARSKETIITVPKPDGTTTRFRLEESPVLAPQIAAQFPNIKTYQGYGIDEPTTTARFDWTDTGFHGYIMAEEGAYSIDPYQTNDRENYVVFYKHQYGNPTRQFHCNLDEAINGDKNMLGSSVKDLELLSDFAHGASIRTYRLAIATTGEYTNFFRQSGDTDSQAQTRAFNAVTTSVNRINTVYRREFAVSLQLVSGTNLVYATTSETPSDYANTGSSADLVANQTNVDAALGNANYDVAHLFETTDSGVATLQSVCNTTTKARGLSGQPAPQGDPFDVDYVAHEMGHQFAGNHTFTATGDCNSSPAAARREPGSAVTIMGYAGICADNSNVQRNSIETFHVYNLNEIIPFITTGGGAACGVTSGTNTPPVIGTLSNYTIPFNTPFELTATATDADNDPLTYNWEQSDPAASATNYPTTIDDDDVSLVFRPGFRSYLPRVSGTRTFPSLTYILNNANEAPVFFTGTSPVGSICAGECITGEDLPSAARTMNFGVTVRDGRGGISDKAVVLTVVNSGTPFTVNEPTSAWTANSTATVTWNVSGTNTAPVNAANVKISLSTDGGQTFPTVLAASTANDGSEVISVPNTPSTTARIKVEAVGNVFFDITNANFTINAPQNPNFANVSGRVVTANGQGIPNVRVQITNNATSATDVYYTSMFGYFIFPNLAVGGNYTVTISNTKRYTFASNTQSFTLGSSDPNLTFTANAVP